MRRLVSASAIILSAYACAPLILGHQTSAALLGPLAPVYIQEQVPVLAAYAVWDWTHRVGGTALLLVGLSQLRGFYRWHRIIGRIYAVLASVMSIGGAWMAVEAPFSPKETLPALLFAGLQEAFVVLGVATAWAGQIREHRRWMQRSYAIMLGPLLVRIVHMIAATSMSEYEAMAPAFWIGWLIPLAVLEVARFTRERRVS
jgi:uncharacterized membrane protein